MASHVTLRRARRVRARGVALVEAAAVFPVLVCFLGLLQFAHAEYDTKLTLMSKVQGAAWDDASHGCVSGGDGSTYAVGPSTPSSVRGQQQDKLRKGSPASSGGRDFSAFGSFTHKDATSSVEASKYRRDVTATARLVCNERNYEEGSNPFSAVLKLAGSFVPGF